MQALKRFRLRTYSITVRDCHAAERATVDVGRDCMAVVIRAKGGDALTCVVGSPMIGSWDEDRATRSAISFASEISCWDSQEERTWVETHGEQLFNEACCHAVLGLES